MDVMALLSLTRLHEDVGLFTAGRPAHWSVLYQVSWASRPRSPDPHPRAAQENPGPRGVSAAGGAVPCGSHGCRKAGGLRGDRLWLFWGPCYLAVRSLLSVTEVNLRPGAERNHGMVPPAPCFTPPRPRGHSGVDGLLRAWGVDDKRRSLHLDPRKLAGCWCASVKL